MSEPLKVQNLCELAATLATASQGVEDMAGSAPKVPDAGVSTGAVAEALQSLAQLMATIASGAARCADLAQQNGTTYQESDHANAESLNRAGKGVH